MKPALAVAGLFGALVLGFVLIPPDEPPPDTVPPPPDPEPDPVPMPDPPTPPDPSSPAAALLAAALSDVPDATTVLGPGDPVFAQLMGGATGPRSWRYYELGPVDDPLKWGTTCEVATVGFAAQAGWPPEMLNRNPPEGRGFVPGAHATFMERYAPPGWLLRPADLLAAAAADGGPLLRPGDAVLVQRQTTKGGGAHMFTVRQSDGVTVDSIDGGRGNGTQIMWASRSMGPGTSVVMVDGPAAIVWVIRATPLAVV